MPRTCSSASSTLCQATTYVTRASKIRNAWRAAKRRKKKTKSDPGHANAKGGPGAALCFYGDGRLKAMGARSLALRRRRLRIESFPFAEPGICARVHRPGSGGFH